MKKLKNAKQTFLNFIKVS